MPGDIKLKFRTNTRMDRRNGCHVSGTDWTNKDEFKFGFWASLCADDAATHFASRAAPIHPRPAPGRTWQRPLSRAPPHTTPLLPPRLPLRRRRTTSPSTR